VKILLILHRNHNLISKVDLLFDKKIQKNKKTSTYRSSLSSPASTSSGHFTVDLKQEIQFQIRTQVTKKFLKNHIDRYQGGAVMSAARAVLVLAMTSISFTPHSF
jgi:hypothetical protein